MSKKYSDKFDMFLVSGFGIVPCRISRSLLEQVDIGAPVSLEYAFDLFRSAIDNFSKSKSKSKSDLKSE